MVRRIKLTMVFIFFLFTIAMAQNENGNGEQQEEDIFELKVKEVSFTIIPTIKLVLPDTSAIIGINQKIGDTNLIAQSEYNYLYSKINYLLQYVVNFYFPLSFSLYDNVNFEKIYENHKYLQRNKGYGAGLQSPNIFNFLTLKQELKNENYYFASIEDKLNINQGNILFYNTWIEFLFEQKQKNKTLRDTYLGINFEKAIPSDFSDYNFLFLNLFFNKIFYYKDKRSLNFYLEYGYLLTGDNLPIWKIYTLGGYERLMGYPYDEFQGLYKLFGRIKGDSIIFDKINWEFLFLKLLNINGFLVANAGNVGSVYDIQDFTEYKFSVGGGIDLNLLFRNKIKIVLTFTLAQAINSGYSPVFYFVYQL